jgi:hypothetical protein
VTLNDEVFVECAEALGKRIKEYPGGTAEKISHGFVLATCRQPRREERDRLVKLYESLASAANTTEENASASGSAWTAIGSVLLNLDEVLNK